MRSVLTVTMSPSIDLSAATDSVVPVRKLRCTAVRRDPGGGGVNVARVLKRLGGHCSALFPAGGSPGLLLHRLLDREGIVSMPVDIAADTRESFTVADRASGDQYRFVLPGAELAPEEWQECLDRVSALAEPPDYIVASGSLPPGAPQDFYARLAHVAASAGSRLVVDSSGPALAAALEAGVYLVKPNQRELEELTGSPLAREADCTAAARRLVDSGRAQIVALSLGDRGALLASREGCLRAAAIPVKIVSAVGAGDSFLAAMVWRLSASDALDDAFRYAVAAGTAALLTPGTELACKEDIERLYRDVAVEQPP
ncbi:6-phosphofructokinase [Tistlia consotensis]|uniref:Phosphofructokinase n=1 Tax=Tistlia consotensis USBA 355 TaxID=560819 RepID=A0A1Y6BTE9_9PROT|nr:1-phosphofructokinase family hexose kinase [Tistlia consotensis]SMF27965.1 6-phosphofructokinase [Tistlia consotensis USBA 355]SNR65375.1 6-phosphofructokinase [Tistlia consotensis]